MADWILPYPEDEHKARLLMGDPVALGYAWIVAYAKQISPEPDASDDEDDYYSLPITADELINTAIENINSDSRWGSDYVSRPYLEGESLDPVFWEKLSLILQKDIPMSKRESFFTCSC